MPICHICNKMINSNEDICSYCRSQILCTINSELLRQQRNQVEQPRSYKINDRMLFIFEVLPSQIDGPDNNKIKIHMPEGDLYIHSSSLIKSEGHIFVTIPEDKEYKLFNTMNKPSEKTYSAADIATQEQNKLIQRNISAKSLKKDSPRRTR